MTTPKALRSNIVDHPKDAVIAVIADSLNHLSPYGLLACVLRNKLHYFAFRFRAGKGSRRRQEGTLDSSAKNATIGSRRRHKLEILLLSSSPVITQKHFLGCCCQGRRKFKTGVPSSFPRQNRLILLQLQFWQYWLLIGLQCEYTSCEVVHFPCLRMLSPPVSFPPDEL